MARDILDPRVEVVPAWNNNKRIYAMPDESHRFGHGADSLPDLLDTVWPGGSCNLPDNFNPSADGTTSACPVAKGEKYMIFDERYC
eukprot:4282577-Heterocapsa_arctica.AAC.1